MLQKVKKEIKSILKDLYYFLKPGKNKYTLQPVFLIGCSRSGTTILGEILGEHKSISYLNEPRYIWHKAYPEFNIWNKNTEFPKLVARKEDVDSEKNVILERLLLREQVINNGLLLLEKLPTNSFRLDFLNCVFPNARYVYLHRNGLEVAQSIKVMCDNGPWWGKHKWKLICELAEGLDLKNKNLTNFEKGLLEWRYSIQFSESFFSKMENNKYYCLSYQTFLEDPKVQVENIYNYLGLSYTEKFTNQITKKIRRRKKSTLKPNRRQIYLGGPNLLLSVENKLRHTIVK